MSRVLLAFIIIFSLILAGCNNNQTSSQKDDSKYVKLSSNQPTDQQISNKVKEKLKNYDKITNIHALNTPKLLILTFEVTHFNRFNLSKLKADIKKEVKEMFPEIDLTVSTDKKIILELRELESNIEKKSISEKALTKKLKEIKKLSEEET